MLRMPSRRLLPMRSGMARCRSSRTLTKPGSSPLGETSHWPERFDVPSTRNGETAMKARKCSSRRPWSLRTARWPGNPRTSRSSRSEPTILAKPFALMVVPPGVMILRGAPSRIPCVKRRTGRAVIAQRIAWLVASGLVAAGCSFIPELPYVNPPSPAALARLVDTTGRPVGQAVFSQQGGRVRILVDVTGLPAGRKAVHIHETGQCDLPSFDGAGSHFNPSNAEHGTSNPRGPHAGDLPDIVVDADGRGHLETTASQVTLKKGATSLLDANGSAIVLHERSDDQKTDPDGASGSRIACGVVVAAGRFF